MKNIFKKLIFVLSLSVIITSCHDDLNQSPIDPDSFTEEDVFASVDEARGALAKLYASLALTGQQGPAGNADIADIDEGFSQFSRMLFNLNEITTDHAVVGWGDPGLPDLHGMYWSSSNDFTEAMYYRLAQEVTFCNSFIMNASNLSGDEVQTFILPMTKKIVPSLFSYMNNLLALRSNFGDIKYVDNESHTIFLTNKNQWLSKEKFNIGDIFFY